MFADLCKRVETGLCSFSGCLMATPSVHIYTAGWVCKDDSPANRVSRKPLGLDVDCLSGESTRTLHSSMEYIRRFRPCAVILENTLRPRNIKIVQELFSQVAGYACVAFRINSIAFHTCSTRPRIYIVAIDTRTVTVTVPMSSWKTVLEHMSALMPRAFLRDCLLPEGSPEVLASQQEHAVCRRSAGRKGWQKCMELHEAVRMRLVQKFRKTPPSIEAFQRGVKSRPDSQGLLLLTPRELDAYCLHVFAARAVLGVDLERYDMAIDATNNIDMAASKNVERAGTMACLLCSHVYVHTQRQRIICGSERMKIQGFNRQMVLSGQGWHLGEVSLSQRELCSLAGNTMSVPVMGALFALLLSCCKFEPPATPVDVGELEKGTERAGAWVGRHPAWHAILVLGRVFFGRVFRVPSEGRAGFKVPGVVGRFVLLED